MKAVIPAAGLGTRFLPATKALPKELLPVLDKPVIQYVVEEALEPDGVDGVVIVNSHEKPQIEGYFSVDEDFEGMLRSRGKDAEADKVHEAGSLPVSFVYQDEPRGLGHAVLCAADAVGDDEPFFVLLGDYFVPDRQMCVRMAEVSREHGGASVIAVAPVPADQVSRYGIIAGECVGSIPGTTAAGEEEGAVWKVTGLVEKPKAEDAPSMYAAAGRYLLDRAIFDALRRIDRGAGGEVQLTDAIALMIDEGHPVHVVVHRGSRHDLGNPGGYLKAAVDFALDRDDYGPDLRRWLVARLGLTEQ